MSRSTTRTAPGTTPGTPVRRTLIRPFAVAAVASIAMIAVPATPAFAARRWTAPVTIGCTPGGSGATVTVAVPSCASESPSLVRR